MKRSSGFPCGVMEKKRALMSDYSESQNYSQSQVYDDDNTMAVETPEASVGTDFDVRNKKLKF